MNEHPVWRKSSYSGPNGDCIEVAWFKSSYSGPNGGCVEVAWFKSSHSGVAGSCVEVAPMPRGTGIRDSKNIDGGELRTTSQAWRSFITAVRTDRI